MTKDEALKIALDYVLRTTYWTEGRDRHDTLKAIKEALAQPEQEPVVFNTLASLKHKKTVGPIERAMLNTTPPEHRNFCSRCGKRTPDLTTIHTCTLPCGLEMP